MSRVFTEFHNTLATNNDGGLLDIKVVDNEFLPRNHFTGEITDIINYVDTGVVEVREKSFNVVVNDISKLIAALMKGQSGYTGISYWAVGSGLDTWDNSNPPLPNVTDVSLVNEIYRKVIPASAFSFLDSNGNTTTSVTNTIQITLLFTESEANGFLREFALYGGNATATKGSGIIINHKTHGLIYKTNNMTLERIMKFTF